VYAQWLIGSAEVVKKCTKAHFWGNLA